MGNSGLLRTIRDWLGLIRIGNVLIIGFSSLIGAVVGSHGVSWSLGPWRLALVVLVPALVGAGGNLVNDYFDRFVDAVNKPWRPIPSGRVRAGTAYAAALLFMAMGVALSILLNLYCFIVALAASILLHEYSRWLKGTGLPGNIVIGLLSLLSIFFGGLVSSNPVASLLPGLYAFLIILGREVFKGIEDLEGDRRHGIRTLAVSRGPRTALVSGATTLLAVVAISPLPYMVLGYNIYYLVVAVFGVDVPILLSIAMVAREYENAWKATRVLKIPLFTGLLAFLVGVA